MHALDNSYFFSSSCSVFASVISQLARALELSNPILSIDWNIISRHMYAPCSISAQVAWRSSSISRTISFNLSVSLSPIVFMIIPAWLLWRILSSVCSSGILHSLVIYFCKSICSTEIFYMFPITRLHYCTITVLAGNHLTKRMWVSQESLCSQ